MYAGFYVFNSVVRPIRMAFSIGLSKYFEMSIEAVQNRTKLSRGLATGVIVFLFNVCGTLGKFNHIICVLVFPFFLLTSHFHLYPSGFMSLGVFIASLFSGVPVFPPKV